MEGDELQSLLRGLGRLDQDTARRSPRVPMPEGHSFLLKVLRGGGSDWLSDLPKVTAVSQAKPQVSFVLLWVS